MPGIGSVLNQAKSSLAAAQTGMNTTANNVSNVNTEGYSRQRVEFGNGEPESYGPHRVGGGVEVRAIRRTTSDFLNRRIGEESTSLGQFEGAADIYGQLELLFKEDGEQGITGIVSNFFNDLRTLSTQPESMPLRAAVRESAEGITQRFRNLSVGIEQVVGDINRRVEGSVAEMNELTDRIGKLNQQIMEIETRSPTTGANAERDARDQAINALSKIVEVTVVPTETGAVNILSAKMGPLVVANEAVKLGTIRSADFNGDVRVVQYGESPNSKPRDITDKLSSGTLGGLVEIRERNIPSIRSKVDQLAFNLTQEVNSIHQGAYNRNGKSGMAFFADLGTLDGAAANLSLSAAVRDDLANIATSDASNAAGDNRAVLRMADLQNAAIFEGGKSSFTDLAASVVGTLGSQARASYQNLETQKGLVDQLSTFQKQVSAVSLDEEAMNMMKFQKAFDASAKMIQVADQMMDTVLNLKRF